MDCECRFVVCKFKLCYLFTGELVFFVLELHLFAKLHTYCAEGLNPPFYRQPLIGPSLLCMFFPDPLLLRMFVFLIILPQ